MKKGLAILLGLMMVGLTACSGTPSDKNTSAAVNNTTSDTAASDSKTADGDFESLTLRLACDGVSDEAVDVHFAKTFADKVSEMTNGAVKVEVYMAAQLSGGNSQRGVEMLTQGTTELAVYSNATIAPVLDESLFALAIPFIYDDYQAVKDMYAATGNDYVSSVLSNHDIKYLGYSHNGFRHFSNNKHSITKPEDMKNLKIRVMNGELYLDIFNALGADPIVMSWSEVYTALQQGTIDGQDNGWMTANSAKLYEVQPYYTIANYTYDSYYLMANQTAFGKLPENVQEVVVEAAKAASEANCQWVEDSEADIITAFKNSGVTINELTDEDKAAFRDLLQKVVDKYSQKYGEEACTAFGVK